MDAGTFQVTIAGDSQDFYERLEAAGIRISYTDSARVGPGVWLETFTVDNASFSVPSTVAKYGPWQRTEAPKPNEITGGSYGANIVSRVPWGFGFVFAALGGVALVAVMRRKGKR